MAEPFNPFNAGWVARSTAVVLLMIVMLVAFWELRQVAFLAFAGLLAAVVFRHSAEWISERTPLGTGMSLVVVILAVIAIFTGLVLLTGPRIASEFGTLSETLPKALGSLETYLLETRWGSYLLQQIEETSADSSWNIAGFITGTFSTFFGVIANIFVVLAVAVFLAVDPESYRRGALSLVPKGATHRVGQYFDKVSDGLFRWFMGQLFAMLVVAVLMAVGLFIIGTPVPIALGIIAGVANFIPYLGPYIGGAPAVLIAFSVEPISALWVALLIVVVQTAEGNVITPNIQKEATSLSPALIILAVVGFGVVFGLLGVMLATPILYTIVTAVKMFYVEDALGKRAEL